MQLILATLAIDARTMPERQLTYLMQHHCAKHLRCTSSGGCGKMAELIQSIDGMIVESCSFAWDVETWPKQTPVLIPLRVNFDSRLKCGRAS